MSVLPLWLLVAACVRSAESAEAEKLNLKAVIDKIEKKMKTQEFRDKMREFKDKIWEEIGLSDEQERDLNHSLKSFKRKGVDNVLLADHTPEEANMEGGIADLLFQGDIPISYAKLNKLLLENDESRFKRQALKNKTHPRKWKKEILFTFEGFLSKRVKSAFRKAANLWTTFTCLTLKELDHNENEEEKAGEDEGDNYYEEDYNYEEEGQGEAEYEEEHDEEYEENEEEEEEEVEEGEEGEAHLPGRINDDAETIIRVTNIRGCSSIVGKNPIFNDGNYNIQPISLANNCETIGTAAHEIAHTLGFWHTQSRHDRDQYITILRKNINKTYSDQFAKQKRKTNDNYGLPYDYGSIMHYRPTAATKVEGMPTMVPKDGLYTQTLGSPTISFYDLLMMNTHYNCTAKCAGENTPCHYGFPHPRNCSKCICPSGYGGQFCDQRPPGCGKEVNATTDWETLTMDSASNMTAGSQDGYKRCNYWIKAPNGTRVEVKILNMTDGVAVDGCIYAGVEIKTHPDQRLTGYRFCSKDDVNTTLVSNSSTVPVIGYMRRRRNHTTPVLGYRYVD